ncbi:MAG TPA: hypothetical protein DEF45_21770 [Rhodopirellula sp.]|nr:MAG: hypothetical protein CBD74_12380 [Saprospirales bacterium TMED214]HBV65643.1 hypothetical protein [Rhodopirellula sp.]
MISTTGKTHYWEQDTRPGALPFTAGRSTSDALSAARTANDSLTGDRPNREGHIARSVPGLAWKRRETDRNLRAFTLIELLLVLALVLMLASVVTPNLLQLYQRTAVTRQAMQVQMVLARARTRAIERMGTQVFQYKPGGNSYSIQTWYSAEQKPGGSDARHDKTKREATGNFVPSEDSTHQLSSSCWFLKGSQIPSGATLSRIFFFPDGTATSHQLGIVGAADEIHWISIDPLTGASRRERGTRGE